jgi:hypothetical protein
VHINQRKSEYSEREPFVDKSKKLLNRKTNRLLNSSIGVSFGGSGTTKTKKKLSDRRQTICTFLSQHLF